MKRHIFPHAAVLALSLLTWSCAEDDGNYNYKSINSVAIGPIDNQLCEAGAHLAITPDLTILDDGSINLAYSWTVGTNEVSTERNLDIDLPVLSYGGHLCALTIKDIDTGMQYRRTFTLTITNPFNYGYYFLTRKDDGSTEMAYIQAKEEDDSDVGDVKYAVGVAEYPFGDEPKQIIGEYGYTSDYSATRWRLTFITQKGETPVIITDNSTFLPTSLVTESSFIDQDKGYAFEPDATVVSMQSSVGQFFISNGQFIRYANGKLYRPARHLQKYYWSHPVMGDRGVAFAWVYDELSRRCYVLQAYTSDIPELGIIADSYAYDNVIEPAGNQEIKGSVIYASDKYSDVHSFNVYAADTDEIRIYNYSCKTASDAAFVNETLLPFPGSNENMAITVGSTGLANNIFYVNSGNEIYSSPTVLPKLAPFLTVPSDLGNIEKIGLSALGNRMVVVLYDENSTEERKGSVVFVDVETKRITHTFPHILHHCVSYWGANESTSLMGYGQYGDGK